MRGRFRPRTSRAGDRAGIFSLILRGTRATSESGKLVFALNGLPITDVTANSPRGTPDRMEVLGRIAPLAREHLSKWHPLPRRGGTERRASAFRPLLREGREPEECWRQDLNLGTPARTDLESVAVGQAWLRQPATLMTLFRYMDRSGPETRRRIPESPEALSPR